MNGRVMAVLNAAKALCVAVLALAVLPLSGRWECPALMSMRKMVGPIPAVRMPMRVARAAQVVHARTHPADRAMIVVVNVVARVQPRHSWTLTARLFWAMMVNRVLRPGRIATAVARVQPVDAHTTRHKILFRVKSRLRQARNARVLVGVAMAPIPTKFRVSRARATQAHSVVVAHAVKAVGKTQVNVVIAPQVSRV